MPDSKQKRPRGWNFKKGAKDSLTLEQARQRASAGGKIGGKAQVPKGFSSVDLQAKAQISRKLNAGVGDDKEGTKEETTA